MQWPCPDLDHPGTPYLHAPGPALGRGGSSRSSTSRRSSSPTPSTRSCSPPGRTLYHYNSATMTMLEAGVGEKQEAAVLRDQPRGRARARDRRRRRRAARLAPRRARGARRTTRRPRLPGPRLDGAPLRAGEGELAPPRRRRPADRHAGVQGVGGAGRARCEVKQCKSESEALGVGLASCASRVGSSRRQQSLRSTQRGRRRPRARSRSPTSRPPAAGGSAGRGRRRPDRRFCSRCS